MSARERLAGLAARIRPQKTSHPATQPGILRGPRRAALVVIAVLVAAASLTSFAESYRGLYDWAREHGLSGVWAVIWPLQVDVFIAVGELTLFVALVDAWRRRSRAAAWLVTLAGLAVSVAGNVGHVHGNALASRATAAVPPLAAAAALAVGLGVLKRVRERHDGPLANVPANVQSAALAALRATTAAGNPLSARQLETRFGLSRKDVTRVRELAAAEAAPSDAAGVPHPSFPVPRPPLPEPSMNGNGDGGQ